MNELLRLLAMILGVNATVEELNVALAGKSASEIVADARAYVGTAQAGGVAVDQVLVEKFIAKLQALPTTVDAIYFSQDGLVDGNDYTANSVFLKDWNFAQPEPTAQAVVAGGANASFPKKHNPAQKVQEVFDLVGLSVRPQPETDRDGNITKDFAPITWVCYNPDAINPETGRKGMMFRYADNSKMLYSRLNTAGDNLITVLGEKNVELLKTLCLKSFNKESFEPVALSFPNPILQLGDFDARKELETTYYSADATHVNACVAGGGVVKGTLVKRALMYHESTGNNFNTLQDGVQLQLMQQRNEMRAEKLKAEKQAEMKAQQDNEIELLGRKLDTILQRAKDVDQTAIVNALLGNK